MPDKFSKNIRRALILKDGADVRTKQDLQQDYDLYQIMENFLSTEENSRSKKNKLYRWMEDHYYDVKELSCMEQLRAAYQKDKPNIEIKDLLKQICNILGFSPSDDDIENIVKDYGADPEVFERLTDKSKTISDKTEDANALKNFRWAAYNQESLEKLIKQVRKKNKSTIYLIGDKNLVYELNTVNTGITYIGAESINGDKAGARIFSKSTNGSVRQLSKKDKESLSEDYEIEFRNLYVYFLKENDEDEIETDTKSEKIQEEKIYIEGETKKTELFRRGEDGSKEAAKDRLLRYMDACFPLIYFQTFEEGRAIEVIRTSAMGRIIHEWSAQGIFEYDPSSEKAKSYQAGWSLKATLDFFIRDRLFPPIMTESADGEKIAKRHKLERSVLVLRDVHNLLKEDEIAARLKYLSQMIFNGQLEDCNIVIISSRLDIPQELDKYITVITLDHPRNDEIGEIIKKICKEQKIKCPSKSLFDKFIKTLQGLSEFDIVNCLSMALSNDGELHAGDIDIIEEQKKRMLMKTNILEMINVKENIESVGGLENLKKWLAQKAKIFKNLDQAQRHKVDVPKGVLIAGMPGCGKSLSAKVAAKIFDQPLLRLDIGRIMGKYLGESEANLRYVMMLTEAVAPCILWIDELEKSFAGVGGDSNAEVVTRLFGTFLTWMQEKEAAVFVVATANDISKLPPELLRRGRFDEVFYVQLPNGEERKAIFKIHVEKRRPGNQDKFDEATKNKISELMRGFSGADIESVVREVIERRFINKDMDRPLEFEDFEEIVKATGKSIMSRKHTFDKLTSMYRQRQFRAASTKDLSNLDGLAPRLLKRIMRIRLVRQMLKHLPKKFKHTWHQE